MKTTPAKVPVLAIACGGTGGHFFPGLSIGREFQRRGGRTVLFIGGHHAGEQIRTASSLGVQAVMSPAVRIPRNLLKLPFAFYRFWGSLRQNRRLLEDQRADAALAMGSFASVPMGMAASRLDIPLVVHEGNARLGRANRFLARRAKTLFLSFPLIDNEQTQAEQVTVGMPVRQQLREVAAAPVDSAKRAAICKRLKLSPELPIVLVFGGSQGAHFFNELVPAAAATMKEKKQLFQLIHLTGSQHNADYDILYKQVGMKAYVSRRESKMEDLYRVADLVICRAGASTIFELALFGKPAILVPFPHASDDHQKANAQTLVDLKAGMMMEQSSLTPEAIVGCLEHWLSHRDEYREMGERIRSFARPTATVDIVDRICAMVGLETPADDNVPAAPQQA